MTINGGSDQVKSKIGGHLKVETEVATFQICRTNPGARRKDEEHCVPESIALRERSQFGLCIYFEHNNKVHNKLELCTLDDLTRASPGSFAGIDR